MVFKYIYCIKHAYKFLLRKQVGFRAFFDAWVKVFLVHLVADPRISQPGGEGELLGSGDCFDDPPHTRGCFWCERLHVDHN